MNRSIPSSRRRRQRGNTLVESALTILLFVTVIVTIADFGQILFVHQTLAERVRAALRHGSVNTYNADTIRNVVLYGTYDPAPGAVPSLRLTPQMVTVSHLGSGTSEDRITVTIRNYPITVLTPFFSGEFTGRPITGTMPFEVE